MAEVLKHPNGLIAKRPKSLSAQLTDAGFTMTNNEVLRSPLTLHIRVMANGKQPEIAQSWYGLFGYRHRIEESEGGSGGAEYKLFAMHRLQNCWLVLSAFQQAENGPPSFLEAWAVLDNTSATAQLSC